MERCPHCNGVSGIEWKDYGTIFTYQQKFNSYQYDREVVSTDNKSKLPVWGKCLDCDKRIKIESIQKKV
jgi:hypothetical protein